MIIALTFQTWRGRFCCRLEAAFLARLMAGHHRLVSHCSLDAVFSISYIAQRKKRTRKKLSTANYLGSSDDGNASTSWGAHEKTWHTCTSSFSRKRPRLQSERSLQHTTLTRKQHFRYERSCLMRDAQGSVDPLACADLHSHERIAISYSCNVSMWSSFLPIRPAARSACSFRPI